MNYFDNLYTLIEIAINNNIEDKKLEKLKKLLDEKNITAIRTEYPELTIFLPYCSWYVIQGHNMLCMVAYIYDTYSETGLLPDINLYDINPNKEKLEYWQYISPLVFTINPQTGFEFASKAYSDCKEDEIWNLFLSGSARIDYYEGVDVPLEQRIKYAIVEYMVRRPQFYTTDDFVDNPILHKKYKKKEE